jgi:hypothetical protein
MIRCRHTGLTIPECCCRACHLDQLRRYAPQLIVRRSTTGLNAEIRAAELDQPQRVVE